MKKPLIQEPDAFSLIEVTIAMGVVSFSLLSMLALLPLGLGTLRDSKLEADTGSIQRQLRAELAALPFSELPEFASRTLYFSEEGTLLPERLKAQAHYLVTGSTQEAKIPGLASTAANSLRQITVQMASPHGFLAAGQKTKEFTILLANQKGERVDQ